jgi:hypothetical protein
MPLRVFISHAATDSEVAAAIQEWIRQTFSGGIEVFVSSRSITPGDDWRARIEDALKNANIVLVICTQHSLSRPWVGFEAGAGWMNGARVVPLCYHDVDPGSLPSPFASRQAVDLGKEEDQKRLINLLAEDGHFDPQLILFKPLHLPERTSRSESQAPSNVPIPTGVTVITNKNDAMDVTLTWDYSQGTIAADNFFIFHHVGTAPLQPADPSVAVSVHSRSHTLYNLTKGKVYRFGIAAAKQSQIGSIVQPTVSPSWEI